jgi:spore germination cell wall hydrolase CwlJ-like protein
MFSGFSSISATTKRLIILVCGSVLLLAAEQVPDYDAMLVNASISDDMLAPMSAADAAAANARLAETTPPDVAAAAKANAKVNALAGAARAADNIAAFQTSDAVTGASLAEARPSTLTALISAMEAVDTASDRELHCLANAVYFESRGEPLDGQLAVAQAILNRVESGRYAASICGVVNQPGQFSFDRSRTPRAGSDWTTARAIAKIAMDDMWHDVAPRAMSFHATYVKPNWAGKTKVAQIGRHIFYR